MLQHSTALIMVVYPNASIWFSRQLKNSPPARFGSIAGRQSIIEMIASVLVLRSSFALNLHIFSSEHIVLNGASALGRGTMLQISTMSDSTSRFAAAQIAMEFMCVDQWRIAHSQTEVIVYQLSAIS
jgi:SnoaL-like domain